jgi:hypothetical protein
LGDGSTAYLPASISNADQELVEKISQIIEENFEGCRLIKRNKTKYEKGKKY